MHDLLDAYWEREFNSVPQISDQFRNIFAPRWLRFHSLPRSKRYAESENEHQIILSRHNAVLGQLIKNRKVVLITTGYSTTPPPIRHNNDLISLDPSASYWRTIARHLEEGEDPAYPNYWHIYASHWNWASGALDSVLRLVADDALSNVFLLSLDDSWLYHPYDGGADIIATSVASRDELLLQIKPWLPSHPAGL